MDWKRWIEKGIGKKLKKLHAWNAWALLLLSITGILLYLPSLRGATAPVRVLLKYTHMVIGIKMRGYDTNAWVPHRSQSSA